MRTCLWGSAEPPVPAAGLRGVPCEIGSLGGLLCGLSKMWV